MRKMAINFFSNSFAFFLYNEFPLNQIDSQDKKNDDDHQYFMAIMGFNQQTQKQKRTKKMLN